MFLDAWLASLWDGDGTRYVVKRKCRKQKDYYVKISTISFLEVKKIIDAFNEVFGISPYNIRALFKSNRKRFLFEIRCDSRILFEWFSEHRLNRFATDYPLDYISGLFWAEGSICIKSKGNMAEPFISLGVKPLDFRKQRSSLHKNVEFRLERALEKVKEIAPNIRYDIYVRKSGKDKGIKTYIIKGIVVKLILYNNPSNYRIFKMLFIEKKISFCEYLVSYILDTTTLNKLLSSILNKKRRYAYSTFDAWVCSNIFGEQHLRRYLKYLSKLKSVKRATELYSRLKIHSYRDLLEYSKRACELLEAMNNELAIRLFSSALNEIHPNTAKFFLKLLNQIRL